MRKPMRRAAALLPVVLFGLVGCQNFPLFPSGPSGTSQSTSSTVSNMFPSMSQAPIDGSGAGTPLELPKGKKLEVCLATGQQMEKTGRVVEAIYYYEQIRELDPRRELFCAKHLSILYDRKGDFEKALGEYEKLIKANPKDAEAHNDLGYGYYCRGKFEAAETNLRKAVEFDPKNKRAWSNLGMALAQLGKYEESLTAFEKAVNRSQALCNIGFIQAAQGRWMEAKDSYAMALKLEPGLQKAQAALQRMEEGPKSKKDRTRQDMARRSRELERPPTLDPDVARGLPFGNAAGAIGADADMISSSRDQPIHLPMPESFNGGRPTRAASLPEAPPLPNLTSPPAALPPIIPLPEPLPPAFPAAPSPSALVVD